jgi:hypothetical protein
MPESSDQVRRRDVFPLPGGAEMTVTVLVTAPSNLAKRSSRRIKPEARHAPVEERWAGRSDRGVDTKRVMLAPRSG